MFFRRIGWLILAIVAFVSGVIFTIQWKGSEQGMKLYDLIKKPDVVEKIVEVDIVKTLVVTDDQQIQIINQEYRDALIKISAIPYDSYNKNLHETMVDFALKALSFPEEVYKKTSK